MTAHQRATALIAGWLALIFMSACSATEPGGGPLVSPAFPSPAPSLAAPEASPSQAGPAAATPLPPTPVPEPTPTQAPALRQLTTGGCCVAPFWAPDSTRVLFIDRPSAGMPAGIWGVGLGGGEPALVTDLLGSYSADMAYRAYPENGLTVIERTADGTRWNLANGARAVAFSADNTHLAWTAGQTGPPFDTARRAVWVSLIDGSQARPVAEVFGGSLVAWLPDGRLLVSGRLDAQAPETSLWAVDWETGQWTEILRSPRRLRSVSLSPGGGWLAYQVLFSDPAEDNGLWVLNLATGERRRLALFGAYRWRAEGRLLVIPLDMENPIHQLWEVEGRTGEARPLTDRSLTPFRIANGDWAVSPDGRQVVFVSAADYNIWLMELPGG